MTVTCPACGTRYRLPPRSRLGTRPSFRCTRCEHVFDPEAGAEGPALDESADEAAAPTSFELAADEPEERPPPPFLPGDDEPAPPPPEPARGAPRAPDAKAAAAAGASPAAFALRSMLLMGLAYGVLSIWLYTHPERVAELMARIPIVGPPVEARISPANIQLADVHGDYHRVQGDTLVFAITGTALNNAPVPVSGVQVQATVRGTVEQRQTVFAGAAPRGVTDLTVREIDLLQTLVPPKDWSLPPGEQTSFLVVFKDPPLPLEEFTAEVVAVRRSAQRPGERRVGAR